MNWLNSLKADIRFKEPLSRHTTLHIGGPADVWVAPDDREDLRKIICRCLKGGISYLVIGKGSNILFSDRGFRGVVICLSASAFTRIEIKGNRVSFGAGVSLNKLLNQTQEKGLGGLEFLAGIPATTGGALVMNAGARKRDIGTLVKNVTVMDKQGRVRVLNKKQSQFGYRRSRLNRYIVLEAEFKLIKRSPGRIKKNLSRFLEQKRKTQELNSNNAGCIFKNPRHRLTAGQMLEACGLRRRRKGGAEISQKHANYIINKDNAKARDIFYLIELARREVKKKFGVNLEPEIKIVK